MRNSDFVISSRIRISRNVEGYPFPNKMDDKRASVIAGSVYETLNKDGAYEIKPVSSMSETVIGTLKEKNLLTSALVKTTYGSLILKRDESVSIMINEQDHLVINATTKGLDIEKAYKEAELVRVEELEFFF